jgi:hypothetical protein
MCARLPLGSVKMAVRGATSQIDLADFLANFLNRRSGLPGVAAVNSYVTMKTLDAVGSVPI